MNTLLIIFHSIANSPTCSHELPVAVGECWVQVQGQKVGDNGSFVPPEASWQSVIQSQLLILLNTSTVASCHRAVWHAHGGVFGFLGKLRGLSFVFQMWRHHVSSQPGPARWGQTRACACAHFTHTLIFMTFVDMMQPLKLKYNHEMYLKFKKVI